MTDIEIDEDNRAIIYASFAGTRGGTRVSSGQDADLPADVRATGHHVRSSIWPERSARSPSTATIRLTVFAGTDRGVFRGRSVNGGQTWFWVPYTNGMPDADVQDLEVHPGTGVMRAATFGRSAFEVNTDHPIGSVLVASGN